MVRGRTRKRYAAQGPVVAEGWSNALANGTLNHLPNKTEVSLARTYNDARRLGDEEKQEAQSAA